MLGFIKMGTFWLALFFLIILANYNPFHRIHSVWCHGGMATCLESFDVQNPRCGSAPGNRRFTGHVFLLAHSHYVLQWNQTRACATNFPAYNACSARAQCETTKTARFGLTMDPWVRYHLSLAQVLRHNDCACFLQQWPVDKTNKFCCLCGSHASMCHTSVRLGTQLNNLAPVRFSQGQIGCPLE